MTKENITSLICKKAKVYRQEYPGVRYGQSIYNVTSIMCPDITKNIVGTENDCFYDDNKTTQFLIKVNELIIDAILKIFPEENNGDL